MTYSKTHQAFAKYLKDPKVFIKPEEYLGPNFKHVLDFWFYIDSLSDLQKKEIDDRDCSSDYNVIWSSITSARNAAAKVVGERFKTSAYWAAYVVTGSEVFGDATYELIGDVNNKVFYDLIMSHKTF